MEVATLGRIHRAFVCGLDGEFPHSRQDIRHLLEAALSGLNEANGILRVTLSLLQAAKWVRIDSLTASPAASSAARLILRPDESRSML